MNLGLRGKILAGMAVPVILLIILARSMTFQGINPTVRKVTKLYKIGISVAKKAMRDIEARLVWKTGLSRSFRCLKWDDYFIPWPLESGKLGFQQVWTWDSDRLPQDTSHD